MTEKGFIIKILITVFLFCLLLGCSQEPIEQKLLKDMVALDRSYIPVLVFTDLQTQRQSEIAFGRFKKDWQRFDQHYSGLELKYGVDIVDKYWQEDFKRMRKVVVSAETFVAQQDLNAANKKLQLIKGILGPLRRRNGIEYFVDGLHQYQEDLELISSFLRGKDELRDKDYKDLKKLFRRVQKTWLEVGELKINSELHGFDQKKITAIRNRVRAEERLLASFVAALTSRNSDRVFQAAQDLKPGFMVFYKVFGDFQPIFDMIVSERKKND